jgi:hypothetical protein
MVFKIFKVVLTFGGVYIIIVNIKHYYRKRLL